MSNVTLYLFRHFHTKRGKQIVGQKDIPLSKRGHVQKSRKFSEGNLPEVDMLVMSPLVRATQSIEPWGEKTGMRIITVPGLIEIGCGDFEGKNIKALMQKRPDLFFSQNGKLYSFLREVPGVTTWENELREAEKTLLQFARDYPGARIAGSTHLGRMLALYSVASGIKAPDIFEMPIPHGQGIRLVL